MVRRVSPFDRMFVLWRAPADGTRHVIGELWRTEEGYAFAYRQTLPIAEGFALLPEFPEHRSTPYASRYLFATFAQRVPSPSRPDRASLMHSWGVENADDMLEVLARSGGIQMTDRIELAEYRAEGDALDRPLEMRIAAASHYSAGPLEPGERLHLVREPRNARDCNATFVVARGTDRIGYVPRQYTAMIARLLDGGVELQARAVRQLVVPPEGGRWVIRVTRAADSHSSL